MTYDLLVKDGLVVDGTGQPGRRADVAVAHGKIVEIGDVTGKAAKTIDAAGCVVAPGFIDPHTHYDAQICWDPGLTPSSWHGITTVVVGNCGVGIAPCRPEGREIATRDLVGVEGIDYDVLHRGITWDWETFPQYLEAASRRGSALNLAFLATLTPFRFYVMGEAASERAATTQEIHGIQRLLRDAMDAGAFGFSTSVVLHHIGYQGRPLACRNASKDELVAYCSVLKDCGKGTIQIALTREVSIVSDEEYSLLDLLLTASGRPITFTSLRPRNDRPEATRDLLHKIESLMRRGAVPQTASQSVTRELSLRAPFLFGSFPSWAAVFDKSAEEQSAIFRDTGFRASFRKELEASRTFNYGWEQVIVSGVASPLLDALEGRTIAEIARERGADGVDVLLDVALADDLQTTFSCQGADFDKSGAEILRDPRILVGMSDAGAHLDMLCDAGYTTHVLGHWVRDKGELSIEQAVQKLTSHPADVFGIKDRGRLLDGKAADIVVFELDKVWSTSRREKRHDLPGGGKRYVMPSSGIRQTIVNGELVYDAGRMTGNMPGRVLHS